MDANKLILKIFEKSLNVDTATEIYRQICNGGTFTIGDALRLKELLDLSNIEAIDIFLS